MNAPWILRRCGALMSNCEPFQNELLMHTEVQHEF